jgi:hypothetical protein
MLVKMLKTYAGADCILFAGRYYNIEDKKIITKLKASVDENGPSPCFVEIKPHQIAGKKITPFDVEVPDPQGKAPTEYGNDPVEPNKG